MALVPAKCTNCGGTLEVDDTKDAAICKYCGSAFIIEKAINSYNVSNMNVTNSTINIIGGNINNLIELAKDAKSIGNGDDEIKYADKILEIDPKNSLGWLMKADGLCNTLHYDESDVSEFVHMIDNALKYADEDDEQIRKDIIVTQFTLIRNILQYCDRNWLKYANNGSIKKLRNLGMQIRDMRQNIDTALIANDETLFLKASECYVAEYLFAKTSYLYEWEVWDKIFLKGIPADRIAEVKAAARKASKTGCYIATAVYGSYDCPEVWVLRRYRDYSLARTWYGRAFIKCYYLISPKIVKYFGKRKQFNAFWKKVLDRKIKHLRDKGYQNSHYDDKRWN